MHPRTRYHLKRLTSSIGLRIAPGSAYTFTLGSYLTLLKQLDFQPQTCIDVGAASGTFEIYDAFPTAFHILIEPIPGFHGQLRTVLKQYPGTLIPVAAGAQNGSAFIQHKGDASHIVPSREDHNIDVRRLDDLARGYDGPFLIKIDVQGLELDVVRGAAQILPETEVLILEVSMFRFAPHIPIFHEVVAFMHSIGYVAHGIFGGYGRLYDGALAQIDIAFVKEDGQFRISHKPMTSEQLAAHNKRLLSRLKKLIG